MVKSRESLPAAGRGGAHLCGASDDRRYSWVEPFLYLLVIGISILVNMGSNLIFGEISYITQSMAALLQLAVSLDYSIFLMHRYLEELDVCKDVDTAIVRATKKAITSISASSLTTIAGFLALVFMQYAIGADIGFVLAKGVLFSLLGCILVMPVILKFASGLINRTRHKSHSAAPLTAWAGAS